MMRLLTGETPLITVLDGDNSEWTALGYGIDALACGRHFHIEGDFCAPEPGTLPEVALTGYEIKPFAVVARQRFGIRCSPEQVEKALEEAMLSAAEHQVGEALWNGIATDWTGTVFLTSAEVDRTITTGDLKVDLAQLLKDAYEDNPDLDPLLHLGMGTALQLGEDALNSLSIPYVVNSGYPVNGIAVTGEVEIRLGSVEVLQSFETTNNRTSVEATRFAAFSFDPCLARLGAETS